MKGFGNKHRSIKKKENLDKSKIINEAIKYHQDGNILKAAKAYQACINQGLKDQRVYSNYGLILKGLGNLEEAESSYRKAIEINPNFAEAYYNLGNILKDLGKSNESELAYKKAIQIKPNFAEAHSNLGLLFQDLKRTKEAESYYRKAIEINPCFPNDYYNLGNLLKDMGKFKDAEIAYKCAIKINPNVAEFHYNIGILFQYCNRFEEAKLSLRKTIQINPNLAEAYNNLGNVLTQTGNLKEAEASLKKALKLNPNSAEAYNNLGNIFAQIGNLKEAEVSLKKALKLNPNLAKSYYILSTLNILDNKEKWQKNLFSEDILTNQIEINLVDIYFARANISEQNCDFVLSSIYLEKANNLNRKIHGSNYSEISLKLKDLDQLSKKDERNFHAERQLPVPILIVGMPRSGKTITESILACNNELVKHGEHQSIFNAISKFLSSKENSQSKSLYDIYIENIELEHLDKSFISNTSPLNIVYTGLIASQLSKAKIIYCYRNPLDNIKEVYKKNMGSKHTYSCSILESAYIWIETNSLMKKYKKIYNTKIHFLNYDKLVSKPEEEIENLIEWLDWDFDSKYLKPSLDQTTKSNYSRESVIINKDELHSWKNYRELLTPAIELFNEHPELKSLIE